MIAEDLNGSGGGGWKLVAKEPSSRELWDRLVKFSRIPATGFTVSSFPAVSGWKRA